MDMADLEENLKRATEKGAKLKAIVTDGVFSMDGDIAPLNEMVSLAKKYDAFTFVDECHATGVFGSTGRGTPERLNLEGKIDVISSTLGKALGGGTGGYCAASKDVVNVLRNKGRPYLFSNSVAPATVGASLEVMKMLSESSERILALQSNATRFRTSIKEVGFEIRGHDECPIVPVMLGDAHLASKMADALLDQGIYVIGFSFPVVPRGEARIRTQLSASHTHDQIDRTVEAFASVGKKFGIL